MAGCRRPRGRHEGACPGGGCAELQPSAPRPPSFTLPGVSCAAAANLLLGHRCVATSPRLRGPAPRRHDACIPFPPPSSFPSLARQTLRRALQLAALHGRA
ncbi:uncharacterized protein [Haliaeetus albicilla]|uniref:uncharacterized protein isoform X5 n=1 Tax=Haliaeetus albicilla TaxID=8969 RepID=UPI0037E77165